MENKKKLGTGAIIALSGVLVLNVLWLISLVVFMQKNGKMNAFSIISIVEFAVAVFYAIIDYKRPNGNLMRYLLLFYSCAVAVMLVLNKEQGDFFALTYLAIIILSTYMAGRLNRYKQNVVICVIVLILEIVNAYPFINSMINSNNLTFISFFACIGSVAIWLAISASYIIRYREHKEAGLADK